MTAKEELLRRIYTLGHFEKEASLDYMERLLAALGEPHRGLKAVHITGSVGKGSVTAFTASILRATGLKSGMFTSPHLVEFNERIQVDGQPIPDEDLLRIAAAVERAAAGLEREPRFHEFVAAIAFVHFAAKGVDIAVVEVAMGGRLDSTNVLTPLVAVITNVSLEHAHIIGPTTRHIAHEKAGIIKPGCSVVTAETDPELLAYFRKEAVAAQCPLTAVHESCEVSHYEGTIVGQEFTVRGALEGSYELQLPGAHQITNALTAALAAQRLNNHGIAVPADAIREGLANTAWPGRLQAVSMYPLVLLDGAHNEAGMDALVQFMQTIPRDIVVLFGLSEGRDADVMSDYIAEIAARIIVTESSFKAQPAERLAAAFAKYGAEVAAIKDPLRAYQAALDGLGEREVLLVAGSLYLVGDILKHVQNKES